jgi:hypothetical protein
VRYAGLQSDYPNLGLLMERVKAFIDFYTASLILPAPVTMSHRLIFELFYKH